MKKLEYVTTNKVNTYISKQKRNEVIKSTEKVIQPTETKQYTNQR